MTQSNLKIAYYKNLLLSMKVATFKGTPVIAKPVLMLSILKMIEDGTLLGNNILFTNELCEIYCSIFRIYSNKRITPAVYPYYYLNSEEFYYVKGDTKKKTPSANFIREQVEFATLDDELWDLLQDPAIRNDYREAIINKFLKKIISLQSK